MSAGLLNKKELPTTVRVDPAGWLIYKTEVDRKRSSDKKQSGETVRLIKDAHKEKDNYEH
jgi:hypothetical protein